MMIIMLFTSVIQGSLCAMYTINLTIHLGWGIEADGSEVICPMPHSISVAEQETENPGIQTLSPLKHVNIIISR